MKEIQNDAHHNNDHDLMCVAVKLADEMGLSGDIALERLSGGRNNQVFKMIVDYKKFLLKSYFVHEDDPRDRLGNELSFLHFAWDKGIRCIPQPFITDKKHHVALYEFVEGERLKESDITEDFIEQAIRFVLELNKYKQNDEAINLPIASEACFSIDEHLGCVERRIKRLLELDPCDSFSKNAHNFIHRELMPAWLTIKKNILGKLGNSDNAINEVIDNNERCLSPSDFGFHNALLEQNGILRFIDFEYAGWDDPAKLICDFFCQPEIPVAKKFLPRFEHDVMQLFDNKKALKKRVSFFFPLYKIKWCCIMLNEFIPEGYAKRSYAGKEAETLHKEEQLDKAKAYLSATLKGY